MSFHLYSNELHSSAKYDDDDEYSFLLYCGP